MVPASASYCASVPGSLRLMGEHAVLRGYSSLVAAVDKRLQVTATWRSDRLVTIDSERLGKAQWSLDALPTAAPPFHFLLAVIHGMVDQLPRGVNVEIRAAFCDQVGLGSSAAVVVASLAALWYAIEETAPNALRLLNRACEVIRQVQGFGSGADAAASIFGGVLHYLPDQTPDRIAKTIPCTVLYSGSKLATPIVVSKVNARVAAQSRLSRCIFEAMQQGITDSLSSIERQDWAALGHIVDMQQGLMNALGVSNGTLEDLLAQLRRMPGVWGAKISGSGLGDCVIGIGTPTALSPVSFKAPQRVIEAPITPEGIRYEVIHAAG